MVRLTRSSRATPPRRCWPGNAVSRSGPSDSMRSCTDFCAPCPSATIVIIAATPMMMPSMVSAERNRWLRSACSATRMISRKNMSRPLRRPPRGGLRWLLLVHAGNAAASGHALDALAHFALRADERRAGEHNHGIAFVQSVQHLDVVEIGEHGLVVHGRCHSVATHEDV